MADKNKHKERP